MINHNDAEKIISEVKSAVAKWREIAVCLGIAKREIDMFEQIYESYWKQGKQRGLAHQPLPIWTLSWKPEPTVYCHPSASPSYIANSLGLLFRDIYVRKHPRRRDSYIPTTWPLSDTPCCHATRGNQSHSCACRSRLAMCGKKANWLPPSTSAPQYSHIRNPSLPTTCR